MKIEFCVRHPKFRLNKWEYIKLKKFCTAKEAINKSKRQTTKWKRIFTNHICDKGLIFKIYKNACISNNSILKNEQRSWIGVCFIKQAIEMANGYVKMCSASWVIREMQTKIMMRYPICLSSLLHLQKGGVWARMRRKEAFIHWWWEHKMTQTLWTMVWTFLKKLEIELLYEPGILLLVYIWRNGN